MKFFKIENVTSVPPPLVEKNSSLAIKASTSQTCKFLTLRLLTSMTGSRNRVELVAIRDTVLWFIRKVMSMPENSSMTHCLFMLRFHLPSNSFDNGRWHKDGAYFDHRIFPTKCVWKYGATFFGPGTLFKDKSGKVFQAKRDQGVRWKVGCDDSMLHSEPPFTEPRAFCSILPCTAAQCSEIWPDRPKFDLDIF